MTSVYQPFRQSQASPIRSEVHETFTYPASMDNKAEDAPVKTSPPQRVTSSATIKLSSLAPQEVAPTQATSKLVVPADKQANASDEFARLTPPPPPSGAPRSPLTICAASVRTASPFRRQASPAQPQPSPQPPKPQTVGAPAPPIVPAAAPPIAQERVQMRSPLPSAAPARAALHQSMMPSANQSAKGARVLPSVISWPFPRSS